jgi:thiosulfate/3-mercaptopyruvate sulfurtransferase
MKTTNLLISNKELHLLLNNQDPNVLILDCRFDLAKPHIGKEQYLAGHIPGAYYVDLEKDLSGPKNPHLGRHPLPTPQAWANTRSQLGISSNSKIVIYDQLENTYSARMWWMLTATGHNNVQILDGGFQTWTSFGYSVMLGEEKPEPLKLDASVVDYEKLIEMNDVQVNLSNPIFHIIDARAAERFRGEVEPLDPVAGHIPGAINRLYKMNLNADSLFKTSEELRHEWHHLNLAPELIVHQCGSGVTACHNLFAMELAGLKGSKLYAGSWSEWCNHPNNPVAISN